MNQPSWKNWPSHPSGLSDSNYISRPSIWSHRWQTKSFKIELHWLYFTLPITSTSSFIHLLRFHPQVPISVISWSHLLSLSITSSKTNHPPSLNPTSPHLSLIFITSHLHVRKTKKKTTFILFSLIFAFQPQTPTLILLTVFYFPPLTKPNPLKSIKNKQASQELWWWPRWRCLVHLIVNPFITVFMYEAIELNSVLSNRCLTYTFQSESMVSQFLLIIILLLDLLLIQHHHHHHHTIITIKIKNNFIWKKNMRQTFI